MIHATVLTVLKRNAILEHGMSTVLKIICSVLNSVLIIKIAVLKAVLTVLKSI